MTRRARRPVRIRWWILVFMFLFALMSFVQRTSIAVAADTMMPVLQISQVQIGWLNTAFLVTYAIMQFPVVF
jgi:MFS transporter, ACS family, glucarate transporter